EATVAIADDERSDPASQVLTVTASAPDAAEPGTDGEFTVSLPAGATSSEAITVNYTIGSSTAVAGEDYASITSTLIIPAGENRIVIPVDVLDDRIIEGDETVVLEITGGSSASFSFTAGAANSATVTIADNESSDPASLMLAVTASQPYAAEPATNGEFTISLPAGITSEEQITVNYTMNGTATADGDYTAITGVLVIPAGANGVSVPVSVQNDQIIEGAETVVMTLAGGSSTSFTLTASDTNGSATVNIADDDNTALNQTLSVVNTRDGAEPGINGALMISLPLGITAAEDIMVNYAVTGTATSGTDYTALTSSVIIPGGENGIAVPVVVIDDRIIEGTETVVLTLTGGTSSSFAFTASGTDGEAAVHIADDENTDANRILSIAGTTDGAEPGTDGAFTISLPSGITATADITVNYTVTGTATGGTDYTALTGTVTIPAEENGIAVPVTVSDDRIIEGAETVVLTLTGGSSTSLAFTASSTDGEATVNIADDESTVPANLELAVSKGADGSEPGTDGSFMISLPSGITVSEDITVSYTATGTAEAGTDFTALTGTIVIPAGENSITVPVAVSDDRIIEGSETVILTLTGGTSASFTFTGTGSATVEIADDESTVPANHALSIINNGNASEPRTDGNFTISLPAGITAAEDITVTYTVGGTATAGLDYTAPAGTAVIPAGQNSVMVPVSVLDDHLRESAETVVMTLTGASSPGITVSIGTANTATVVIADDDDNSDLSVTMAVDNASPMVGGTVVFTIGVTNAGPEGATGVAVLGGLPSGYTFVSAEASGGSYDAASGVWTVGGLASGGSRTLRITALVNGEGDYLNRAEVRGNEDDPDSGNNTAEITVIPVRPPQAVDDAVGGTSNRSLTISVLGNDEEHTYPVDASSIEIVSAPQHGTASIGTDGTITYVPATGYVGEDRFSYRVKDSEGHWSNVAEVAVTVAANPLRITNIFTPNGDGQNDRFEIIGLEAFDRAELVVFNRWGNEVYRHNDYDNSWGGGDIYEGTYYYVLTLHKGGTQQEEKGWVVLKRK
ncbi:Calx-beta domain-containing protein, partial [Parapedobacter sp. GCM10030251]|uniref:Calx-beta domain-containing protein n=1 Tax=Parapedobacter sp. GCM10030251 TaxID=3273419 RepID=UPI0036116C56